MAKKFLSGIEVSGLATIASPDAVRSAAPTNLVITPPTASGIVAQRTGYNPLARYLWHDLLAFSKNWGVPLYETKTSGGVWSTSTDVNAIRGMFAQKEDQAFQLIDGVVNTAVRWTWGPNSNIAFSFPEWWILGFTWTAVNPTRDLLLESSADGSVWTTRHTSTAIVSNASPSFLGCGSVATGDTYWRLTITHTNGQPLIMSAIRALSARWGNQGKGSEQESPYQWDAYQRFAIGGSGVLATATLLVQPTASVGDVGVAVRGMAGQAGDLQQWQTSAGAVLARIEAAGAVTTPETLASKSYVDANAGGGNVFVQNTAPSSPPATYLWVQTGLGESGTDMTFWVEDGS